LRELAARFGEVAIPETGIGRPGNRPGFEPHVVG
jgi:hypothetical protein